ncbi:hydroxypyruvate isomerase family protein [Thermogutta sp.]|uniref:hydroxypyruvate isomerase family protein n=1 Tax=Thermogutta sp. TaxID=1962930 RepID=UPI003C79B161
MKTRVTRRAMMGTLAGTAMAATVARYSHSQAEESSAPLKGNINHSVCRWCYGRVSLEELCAFCKKIGIKSVELLGPNDFETIKKYGLTCAMVSSGASIPKGFNKLENHGELVERYEKMIPIVAEAGFTNLICFSGNREPGLDDEQGLKNCVVGIKRILGLAEKHKVVLVMELLNSKVNHKDYMCDHTAWGVELCKRIGSENFKLLYDIYHMQIMEGDLIRTIQENIQYIAHFHTGGNPGRHEIDETQEIYYPAVMRAIVATGYKGFVGQEFVPRNPEPAAALASLERCVKICDV